MLTDLRYRFPLPQGWSEPEVYPLEVSKENLRIKLVGLSSIGPEGHQVIGSAGDFSGAPVDVAYFELIERLSIIEAELSPQASWVLHDFNHRESGSEIKALLFPVSPKPELWRYAKSNGVAVGLDFTGAAQSAVNELVERDQVLRSWYSQNAGAAVTVIDDFFIKDFEKWYSLEVRHFGTVRWENGIIYVSGIFGFPLDSKLPVIYGFGAGSDLTESLLKSRREFYQRFGFLHGEALPETEPPFSPSPDYHQEHFLYNPSIQKLRSWIEKDSKPSEMDLKSNFQFAEITPDVLRGKLCVVKALNQSCLKLTFGKHRPEPFPDISEDLLIHPIA